MPYPKETNPFVMTGTTSGVSKAYYECTGMEML